MFDHAVVTVLLLSALIVISAGKEKKAAHDGDDRKDDDHHDDDKASSESDDDSDHKDEGDDVERDHSDDTHPGSVDGLPDETDDEGHDSADYHHDAVAGSKEDAEEFSKLSPEDSKERLAELVDEMDKNKDKFISLEELTNWMKHSFTKLQTDNLKHKFSAHDANHDGKVSWAEIVETEYKTTVAEAEKKLKSHKERHVGKSYNEDKHKFTLADDNHDGFLSNTEFDAFIHPHKFPRTAAVEVEKTIRDLDRNKDGLINMTEFLGQSKMDDHVEQRERQTFTRYDVNKNGNLEKLEVLQWITPTIDAKAVDEANYLMSRTDKNKDRKLSKDEIVGDHQVWVGSSVTNYGRHFMDEL